MRDWRDASHCGGEAIDRKPLVEVTMGQSVNNHPGPDEII